MKIVPTILALTIFLPSQAQNTCDEGYVLSVSNANFKPLPYNTNALFRNPSTGKYFGCGAAPAGKFCELTITKGFYDADNCEMMLEWYYNFHGLTGNQQPFDYVIFLAEPRKNQKGAFLPNIRKIAFIPGKLYDNGNIATRYSDGYFNIRFSFATSDRLYFDAGPHVYLTEYSVGCLLQGTEYRQVHAVK